MRYFGRERWPGVSNLTWSWFPYPCFLFFLPLHTAPKALGSQQPHHQLQVEDKESPTPSARPRWGGTERRKGTGTVAEWDASFSDARPPACAGPLGRRKPLPGGPPLPSPPPSPSASASATTRAAFASPHAASTEMAASTTLGSGSANRRTSSAWASGSVVPARLRAACRRTIRSGEFKASNLVRCWRYYRFLAPASFPGGRTWSCSQLTAACAPFGRASRRFQARGRCASRYCRHLARSLVTSRRRKQEISRGGDEAAARSGCARR